MVGRVVVLLCMALALVVSNGFCQDGPPQGPTLYLYTAENCPHCKEYRPLLMDVTGRYPALQVVETDIWLDRDAFQELLALLKVHGDLPVSTPTVFLGRQVWIGLDRPRLEEIDQAIQRCLQQGCIDARVVLNEPERLIEAEETEEEDERVSLPILGLVDPYEASLPLLTLVLGLLDSINPCAFFVLLFLLSLMVHAHSRARMLTVGLVFVTFSGLIYFLFMAAWLNLFLATDGVAMLTTVAGLVALFIGVVNIKDYFLFHKGVSLSIPERVKPSLYQRVRKLVQSAGYPSLLGGTAMLAIAANSYELLCTAGFPMVYTRILTLKQLTAWQYYGYLACYNLVYVTPLVIIVVLFAVTLGTHQLSERQGRTLKLISGMMMAELGLVLLFAPHLLSHLPMTILLFGAVFALVAIVLLIDSWRTRHGPHKSV